jgi:serine/threonine-protein kinase
MSAGIKMNQEKGQQVHEYRLRELRGQGEFSTVWEAETPDGALRALKFLPCVDEAVRQEIRTIQQVGQLEHPHLLPVEKILTVGKFFVVAMKLADASLQDLFEAYQTEYATAIEAKELCQFLTQAAVGLDFLNNQKHHVGSWPAGIQHCNIKPTNLLLFGDKLRIGDFNLASPTSRAVAPGRRLGTAAYTPPEVFHGRLTPCSDQYSLASTYVYLRGGRPPFAAPPEPAQPSYVRPAPDLSMLSEKERPIIARALSQNAPDRWKTCGEMMANLTQAVR